MARVKKNTAAAKLNSASRASMRPLRAIGAFIAGCQMMANTTTNRLYMFFTDLLMVGWSTKRAIREQFGQCKLVPCCTICNMGLGAYHGSDDNDRRQEIVNWFLLDERFPEDRIVLDLGYKLVEDRSQQGREREIYEFPGVGRVIYIEALVGLIKGDFDSPDDFPEWLKLMQSELAEWLRGAPRRKSQYFLEMANLESYELLPHARDNPRGQFK